MPRFLTKRKFLDSSQSNDALCRDDAGLLAACGQCFWLPTAYISAIAKISACEYADAIIDWRRYAFYEFYGRLLSCCFEIIKVIYARKEKGERDYAPR